MEEIMFNKYEIENYRIEITSVSFLINKVFIWKQREIIFFEVIF